jgi:peroxiredoxin Q/BCP
MLTPGCTKEACHFRDLAPEFAAAGVQRIGISRDAVSKQQAWTAEHGLDYPLLADVDGAVTAAYGVKRDGLLKLAVSPTKRTTFAIRADGTIRSKYGAACGNRTHDLLITSETLCRLS